MTKVQRITLEANKLALVLQEGKLPKAELADAAARYKALGHELVAAQEAEARETGSTAFDAESTELRSIIDRASVSRIASHVAQGRSINDGAERELQSHYGVDANAIPLRLLMPEHRAAASFGASPATPASAASIAGQVFGDSVGAFVNVAFEDVPAGTRSHPVITTGALGNVGTPAKSAAQAETDAVLAVKELTPKRAQVGFAYAVEDAAVFANVDAGLSENIRAGLRDKLDDQILNRTASGLLTTGLAADPTAPGAATTAAEYIAALSGGVDGRYAMNESQVRLLVGTGTGGTYAHMAGLAIADAGRVVDIMGARLRVSPHVGDYAGNHQDALVIKGSEANTVMAVWPGVELLRDPYTREGEGEIRLIGYLLHDFAIVRTGGYSRVAFRTS